VSKGGGSLSANGSLGGLANSAEQSSGSNDAMAGGMGAGSKGLAGSGAAGGSSSAFGSRSSNVLSKFTYVLGGLFFVLAFGDLAIAFLFYPLVNFPGDYNEWFICLLVSYRPR